MITPFINFIGDNENLKAHPKNSPESRSQKAHNKIQMYIRKLATTEIFPHPNVKV